MIDLPIKTKSILANTHGQPLSYHLFAVGYLAYQTIVKLKIHNQNLANSAFIAGVFHDLGKIDPKFQQWVTKKYNNQPESIELSDDGVHIDSTVKGLGKFTFETYPRHHEISWLLSCSLLKEELQYNKSLNNDQLTQILHSIYWHHIRPYRKKNQYFHKAEGIYKLFIKSLNDTNIDKIIDQLVDVFKDITLLAKNFQSKECDFTNLLPILSYPYQSTKNDLPSYKIYNELSDQIEEFVQDIKPNALNNLIRMAVINADRLVSKIPSKDLAKYLAEGSLVNALNDILQKDSHLKIQINQCIQGFNQRYPNSERNQSQDKASNKLAELQEIAEFDERDNVAVLQGPAGCGKTKIALEWAAKTNAQKIIWICPRVQVCLGILQDLTHDDYLPKSKIEIFTGEYKKILTNGQSFDDAKETDFSDYFSGDIVITTIDQVLNNIISHQKITGMINFMQAHVVFDEYHELIPMPAFNLLFAELIEAKKMRKHLANTLLVSATPHDYFIKNILNIDETDIIRINSFNNADYAIEFQIYDETNEISPLIINEVNDDKITFIITNTAQDAQLGFLLHQENENAILLHSKYTRQDKAEWFEKVYASFKQNGSNKYQILRSGPIVQASLNISCERMYTDITSPENWLQRLGRLDRFNSNNTLNIYTTVLPKSAETGKKSSDTANFLASMNLWYSSIAWLKFVKNYLQLKDTNIIKINDLYQVYQDFYHDENCQKEVKKDLNASLKESVKLINDKIIDPISMPDHKKQKNNIPKVANISLRGDNRFVQMAICEVDKELNPSFINEYAYPEDIDHSKITVGLTESVIRMQGGHFDMRDSNKDLIAFMHKKHHNIMSAKYLNETFKATRFDWELLKLARSPEFPIYLSYTPKDLEPIGGERERHAYAMYYVKIAKQPVGTMSIDKFKNLKSIKIRLKNRNN